MKQMHFWGNFILHENIPQLLVMAEQIRSLTTSGYLKTKKGLVNKIWVK